MTLAIRGAPGFGYEIAAVCFCVRPQAYMVSLFVWSRSGGHISVWPFG